MTYPGTILEDRLHHEVLDQVATNCVNLRSLGVDFKGSKASLRFKLHVLVDLHVHRIKKDWCGTEHHRFTASGS